MPALGHPTAAQQSASQPLASSDRSHVIAQLPAEPTPDQDCHWKGMDRRRGDNAINISNNNSDNSIHLSH